MHGYSCYFIFFKTHFGSKCIYYASESDNKEMHSLFSWKFKLFMNGNHIGGHGVDDIYECDYIWSIHLGWRWWMKRKTTRKKGKIGGLCVVILHSYGVLKTALFCCYTHWFSGLFCCCHNSDTLQVCLLLQWCCYIH